MTISGRPLPNFAKRRSRNSPGITPPLRGSRRSRAEWRRLMRWGVRTRRAKGEILCAVAVIAGVRRLRWGSRRSRAEWRRLMRPGGSHKASHRRDLVRRSGNRRRVSVAGGESQKSSRMAKADAVGGQRQAGSRAAGQNRPRLRGSKGRESGSPQIISAISLPLMGPWVYPSMAWPVER